ncbi:MAG TPA: hypothetical protein VIM10_15095 [Actinopolymorphaceae bacterium]|jgi:hypothetical protein
MRSKSSFRHSTVDISWPFGGIELPTTDALPPDSARLRPDGWLPVLNVPGWDAFRIDVRAAVVDGEPRPTELRLQPRYGDIGDLAFTGQRLRSLPVAHLARVAVAQSTPRSDDLFRALAGIGKPRPEP